MRKEIAEKWDLRFLERIIIEGNKKKKIMSNQHKSPIINFPSYIHNLDANF